MNQQETQKLHAPPLVVIMYRSRDTGKLKKCNYYVQTRIYNCSFLSPP